MNVAILGARGMLGLDLADAGRAAGWTVAALDLPETDITDPDGLAAALPAVEAVVSCAAYTRVDDAEREQAAAFAVNAAGAGHVARLCAARGARLLHVSTDYVFDGRLDRPYREEDAPAPLNAYGAGKLAGERAVAEAGGRHLVVRVQSLFGRRGRCFARTIAERLAGGADELRVVNDQVSAPTYTRHLAGALVRLLGGPWEGVVHVSAAGACTWHAFAGAIARRVRPEAVVHAVSSAEYPTPARRPVRSLLDNARYRAWTGHRLPPWEEGLDAWFEEMRHP